MKKSKKILAAAIGICILFTALSGCNNQREDEKLTVLCTVFPVYDWVCNIVGNSDTVKVELLVQNGTDLHSFQPSFADIAKIKNADAVVYVGGESDKWVKESVADEAAAIAVSELDGISLYSISSEYIAEEHEHDEEEGHKHGSFDEHIWLSVKNAAVTCNYVSEVLCSLDADGADNYKKNTEAYISSLNTLDKRFSEICADASAPLVFADRFPFVYLFRDYGLEYYAAFEGCTTDTGASPDTIVKLANRLDEIGGRFVLVTENPTKGLAEKVIEESSSKNAEIIALNSMQSVKADSGETETYISIMESNASALEKILKTEA